MDDGKISVDGYEMRRTRDALYLLALGLVCFCVFCGWLVVESGLFDGPAVPGTGCILLQKTDSAPAAEPNEPNTPAAPEPPGLAADTSVSFGADNAPPATVLLGAADPCTEDPRTGFKFQLELGSQGAGIRRATFSNGDGRGFDDRNPENPHPLVVFSPAMRPDGGRTIAMANGPFVFADHRLQLPLDRLHWKSLGTERSADGSQTARFQATIKIEDTDEPVIRLTKSYTVRPGTYLMDFDIAVENLSQNAEKVSFSMFGPGGLGREAFRTDMRKLVAAFRDLKGQVVSVRLDQKKLRKAGTDPEARRLRVPGAEFLWVAAVNKYFAAILVPRPEQGKDYADWVNRRIGWTHDPDGQPNTGDESIGVDLNIAASTLAAAGQPGSSKTYRFQLYIGPKDKSFFDKNPMYRTLGFVHTIDFIGCCCPAWLIKPLAFGILAIMKAMYSVIGNYGVVIIILVFLVRLVMHPITRKSQVSMSKMQKLAPMAEEIKKKYANNKAEMQKQLMALYREQGASPIMGFLPMLVQMPIWIALWSAVYASIDLRGAAFLPFWMTDLSVPDALVSWPAVTIPLVGWKIESLNLLPILMGVAFYLQQKLMPRQGAAAANPQVAQQQKMMMIMMPLLFPLMLYKAPSGVNLYIMASTFAGVIEQHVIRKHIRQKEQAESQGRVSVTSKTGGKVKKKKPKPFFKT